MKTETLQALMDEATPGPWQAETNTGTGPVGDGPSTRANVGVWSEALLAAAQDNAAADEIEDAMDEAWICGIWGHIDDRNRADALLIALAPQLAAENLKLRATLAKIADEKLTIGRSLHATLNQIILDAKEVIKSLEEGE